ncbi:thermonuclease family protein [Streptomyces sp. BV286]|uniref:thermonuclease family protein n=1 Tax=Streptomyces sp. BV286 TaxID=2849672 RepID=UPI0020C66FD1|nr:thermonuclease family protein [Streptomyces sp. BV286]
MLPPGSSARIQRDAELTDRYDRYLLYVWNEQGTFVNESLVSSGHAEAVLFPPNDKYWPVISQAEDTARQTVAGLWAACPETTEPSAPDTPARPDLPDGPPPAYPTWIARTFPVLCGLAPRTRTDSTETVTASAATPTEQRAGGCVHRA